MSNKNARKGTASDESGAADAGANVSATERPMTPVEPGAAVTGDGTGIALPPVPPVAPPAPVAPVHEWNDEFTGVGGSYVVIDGKRVPADQA